MCRCALNENVFFYVIHIKWDKANESQVEKIIHCIIFLIENGSHKPEHHTRVNVLCIDGLWSSLAAVKPQNAI